MNNLRLRPFHLICGCLALNAFMVFCPSTIAKTDSLLAKLMSETIIGRWEKIEQGLHYKKAVVASEATILHAWKFDPKAYRIKVAVQADLKGSYADDLRKNDNAILAVNGGFFEIDQKRRLSSSGFLVARKQKLAAYAKRGGSGIVFQAGKTIQIDWSKNANKLARVSDAVQAGPLVVDPGRKNGISRNDFKRVNRTAICQTNGKIIFFIVTGGLSLYELGELL